MREHAPEPPFAGQRLERRAGLGDRDELLRSRPGGEVMVEGERLDRRPRLAADDEERVPDPRALEREHGRGIGAVEDGEGGRAEARRQHLGRQARAAHAAHDRAREPLASHGGGEAGELLPLRQRGARGVDPAEVAHGEAKHNQPF